MIKKILIVAGILFVVIEVIDTVYFVFSDFFENLGKRLKVKKGTDQNV